MPLPITFGAASARGFGLFSAPVALLDEYFEYVTLLLPGNGTNGAQNNTFLDSSTNNFTITRNGNTTQGAFSPYGSNWSNYFDGSGDYLSLANPNTNIGSVAGDFTIEFWVNWIVAPPGNANGNERQLIGQHSWPESSSGNWWAVLGVNVGLYFSLAGGGSHDLITSSSFTWSVGRWYHVAAVRSGSTVTLYLDGTSVGSGTSTKTLCADNVRPLTIGADNDGSHNPCNAYISNLRFVKGTAVYTAAFTPPTAPLTAITNTSLLTCQSNRFIDNSSNAFAITVNGSPSVQRFSPFNPSASYSTSVIGGSGYFDGSGDSLTLSQATALSLGTGDFSVEAWVYPTANPSSFWSIIDARGSATNIPWAAGLRLVTGALKGTFFNGADIQGTITVPLNAWTHIVFSRVGSTLRSFVNGVLDINTTMTTNLAVSGTQYIGAIIDPTYDTGYMTDFRVVKGSGVTSVTVPTTPLTAITNTVLLLNMTNAGVIDNAMMNDLETVGSAQISTAQSKFGGSSLLFNGTTDKCVGRTSPNLNMGSGDFTVECWVYWNGGSTPYQNFVGSNSASFAGNATFFRVWGTSAVGGLANKVGIGNPTHDGTSSVYSVNSLATGTWTHVAATRSSGIIRVFINGNLERTGSSDTSTYDFGDNGICVGQSPWDGANGWYNGYIDDLRITKGVARYTANFTAPTAPFPTR